jgi:IPT/TIG domain
MAQSILTTTPSNPSPPTNFSYLGTTPPTSPSQAAVDDGTAASGLVFAAKLASADNANFPSLDAEGKGTEVAVTQTYSASVYNPAGPLVTVSTGPVQTAATIAAGPNATHASSLSPAANPTLTSISPTTSVHGTAAITMTATGVGFTKQSKIALAGVPQTTTYVSSTSLTCLATPPATAGTVAVVVLTGGVVQTAAQTWTIS